MIVVGSIALLGAWLAFIQARDTYEVASVYGDEEAGTGAMAVSTILMVTAGLTVLAGVVLRFALRASPSAPSTRALEAEGLTETAADVVGRRLRDLAELHERGAISDAELADQRKRILDSQ